MSDEVRVARRRMYEIGDLGRAAIGKFLRPDYAFEVYDLGPNDDVTLTVTITVSGGEPSENGIARIHLTLPAKMVEEVPQ